MRNTRMMIVASALLATALAASRLWAEDEQKPAAGTIIGLVVDAADKPAADVIVVAQQSAEKMRQGVEAVTDKDGKFTLDNVPEGDYNLKFRTRDLKHKAQKSASVLAGQTTDVGTVKLRGV